jgi:hypothetical protein
MLTAKLLIIVLLFAAILLTREQKPEVNIEDAT